MATATDGDLPAQKLTFSLVPVSAIAARSSRVNEAPGKSGSGSWESEIEAGVKPVPLVSAVSGDEKRQPSLGPIAAVQGAGARPIPEGATLDPATGVFRWTPTEAQGPGKYPITVRITDSGGPPLSAEQTFIVTVNEVNVAPKLSVVSDQSIEVGRELTFTATALDADLPANILIFSLNPGAPDGAKISSMGVFSWTPIESQGGVTYPIGITAVDDGTPSMSDSKVFKVTVAAVQREIRVTGASVSGDSKFSFTWSAQVGRSYQVQFKSSLSDTEWINVEPPVTPTGETATFSSSISDAFARFYRVTTKP